MNFESRSLSSSLVTELGQRLQETHVSSDMETRRMQDVVVNYNASQYIAASVPRGFGFIEAFVPRLAMHYRRYKYLAEFFTSYHAKLINPPAPQRFLLRKFSNPCLEVESRTSKWVLVLTTQKLAHINNDVF